MNVKKIITEEEKDTIKLGERIGKKCKSGDIICMTGELGAGKTTLVKGIAKGLKINKEIVHSPTFVLMDIYEGNLPVFHFDLYRLDNEKEIVSIGYDEFLYGKGISVIEWAEKMGSLIPKEYLQIKLSHIRNGSREIRIKAIGQRYEKFIVV